MFYAYNNFIIMKYVLLQEEKDKIIEWLQHLLQQQKKLSCQKKTKLFCYYITKWTTKKLLFYINPRANEVIFGIGHRWTDILEKYPILPSIADETKTSVIKFSIKKTEDIEKKAIKKIIELAMS